MHLRKVGLSVFLQLLHDRRTVDVGMSIGSTIDWTCQLPFRFTDEFAKVDVEVKPGN